jgi:hypothetical protein
MTKTEPALWTNVPITALNVSTIAKMIARKLNFSRKLDSSK